MIRETDSRRPRLFCLAWAAFMPVSLVAQNRAVEIGRALTPSRVRHDSALPALGAASPRRQARLMGVGLVMYDCKIRRRRVCQRSSEKDQFAPLSCRVSVHGNQEKRLTLIVFSGISSLLIRSRSAI